MRPFYRAAIGLTVLADVASAQSLETRVADARGSVVFTYTTRPNVCGNGGSIYISDDTATGWNLRSHRSGVHIGTRRSGGQERCDIGPAQVLLRRDDGRVADLRVWVGGRSETGDTHLGDVPPADAARYLLALESADDAILGAQIADDVVTWPTLLQIARDNGASESARKSAVFWVSHEASVAATRGLDSIAVDDDVTLSVRKDALFFLAQRPNGEGIPALLRVAETSKSRALRKDAIWFLAQSRDSRALELFEKLLAGR
jgi:hypothetical protein